MGRSIVEMPRPLKLGDEVNHSPNAARVQGAKTCLAVLLGDNPVEFPRSKQALALQVSRQGIPVFPVHFRPMKNNPAKLEKVPAIKGWKDGAASILEAQILAWWQQWPNAEVGFPTGAITGIAVLDLDMKDGKDGIAACSARGVDPDSASPMIGQTRTGGRHLYFRHKEGLRCNTDPESGIDVRADDGYAVIYEPLHHLDVLPEWPAAFVPAPRPPIEQRPPEDMSEDDWAEVERALTFAPADCPRDDWRNVGMALHHAGAGSDEAFAIWAAWSRTALPINVAGDRELVSQWRSFGRKQIASPVTLGTLFHLAEDNGYERPRLEISPDDFDDLPPAIPITDLSALLGVTPAVAKPSRLTFLSPANCKAAPSRGYLIKGLFAPYDVGCIFGAPGAGKSLLAPFLGYAVAQGREAFGMRTKAGGVFYVAAEDPMGMRGRVRALEAAHGDAPDFKLVEGVSNLLMQDSPDLAALVEAVKAECPALIFIDTLAMAFPGLEENDAKAMGRVVAVARHLSRWGAAVILIHHDTKAGGATPRGHSLLDGALDVALHVKRDEGGIIRGKLTKNRNGTCDRDIAFCIATEDGDTDEDGDVITLPRCAVIIGGKPTKIRMPTGQAGAAMNILQGLHSNTGEAKIPKADWRKACASSDAVCSKDDDARKKAFYRALELLVREGHVQSADGFCWITDDFDMFPASDGQGHSGDMSPGVTKDKDTVARDGQGHTP
ncbi:MAG: AAA family ATPase [Paracoccaceae bacterium]